MIYIFYLIPFLSFAAGPAIQTKLLKEVESKYAQTSGVQMTVVKKITIPLLEKEKISEGDIKIKKNGFFKWYTTKPEKNMVLLTPEAVWVVDEPMDDQDRTMVLKSRKPKKNQSPAVVTFLMGKGSLTKNYNVLNSLTEGDSTIFSLKAKSNIEPIKELKISVSNKNKTVEQVNFVDHIGNKTKLEFSNIKFDQIFNKSEFEYKPAVNADVTVLE